MPYPPRRTKSLEEKPALRSGRSPSSPTGKHADILAIRASEAVFVELKRLDQTKVHMAVQHLTEQIMFATSEIMSQRFGQHDAPKCSIEMFPEALDMLCGEPRHKNRTKVGVVGVKPDD
jgi:hypothetical protein